MQAVCSLFIQYFLGHVYNNTLVCELNLFYDFGKNDHVCACVGKTITPMFLTQYGVQK